MFQKRYVEENHELLSASVTEEEGAALTLFRLTGDEAGLEPRLLSSFLERSLLMRTKKGALELTGPAMDCLSLYPLLGKTAPSPVPYPQALISFLFSLLSRGVLSDNPSQRTRYLNSELFSSFFPGYEKARISKAAVRIVNAFQALGLLRSELGDLYLERSAAEDFMKLSEHMRLAHMINPDADRRDAGKCAYALYLYSRSEEDNEETRALISRVTGYTLPSAEVLRAFFIEPGARIQSVPFERGVISSDFTITFRGIPSEPVFIYAEPVKCDTADTWMITKQSVRAALSLGMGMDDILTSLSNLSSTPVPDAVRGRIQSWSESFSALRCMRAVILIADERNARILDALPMLKSEILTKPAENVFIMESSTEAHWRRVLENSGLDMLAFPSGSSTEQKAPAPSFYQTVKFPSLPERRTVPYDPSTREPAKGATALEEAYKRSGLLLRADDRVPEPDTATGLYYQEKLRLVKAAANDGKLYAEFADGTVYVAQPERTEDSDIILMLGEEVAVSKLWKCSLLPCYIKDMLRKAPAGDNQDTESL